jgi:hypothetical protein
MTTTNTTKGDADMQVTHRGSRYLIIDGFLDDATLAEVRRLMDRATFTEVESVIYPATDGNALRSRGTVLNGRSDGESGAGRPKAYERILKQVAAESEIFGTVGEDWDRVGFTFWQYPAGSRLSWHNDTGNGRRGEFIIFLHQEWKASWGGELMILDEDQPAGDGAIANGDDFIALMENQVRNSAQSPVAIVPRPNRLVLVKAGTAHQINRVDPTAESSRRTLTGFVSKKPGSNGAEARDAFLKLLSEPSPVAR